MLNVYCSSKPTCVNWNPDANHKQELKKVSQRKQELHAKLDKRLYVVFMHCDNDNKSPICKILWEDVATCLRDIDDTNHKMKFHKWHSFVDDVDDDLLF